MAATRQRAASADKIVWWNRPITWAIGLLVLVALTAGSLGSHFGPERSEPAPAPSIEEFAPPVHVEPTMPVESDPLPSPSPDAESGDSGISINGDNNNVYYNASPPPSDELSVRYRPTVERVTIIEEQPVIVERTIRRTLPARHVQVAARDPHCEDLLAEHDARTAQWSTLFNK